MGKKGGWITALKKAFASGPKDKPTNFFNQVQCENLPTELTESHGLTNSTQKAHPKSASDQAQGGNGLVEF
uniref:Uncharacterized protein n=1 Tax=Oryza barthii TaxID=65489 RepID=A0A0D3EXC3_9ORYZ